MHFPRPFYLVSVDGHAVQVVDDPPRAIGVGHLHQGASCDRWKQPYFKVQALRHLGACIIKLITAVIYGFRNKLVFVPKH